MNADERKSSYEDSRDPKKLADNESETASNDDKFPGYPHYPAKEDIMHPTNRMEKIAPDPENLTKSGMYVDSSKLDKPVSSSLDIPAETDEDLIIVPGTEADVTKDDLIILGEQNLDLDEEEEVDNTVLSGDMVGDQLDVPGEELDDSNESLGEEDEENNYYSLGGDRQENLEEN